MEEITFEAALEELETIVSQLEAGEISLDESIKCYQRGSELLKFCSEKLAAARLQIEQLSLDD